MVDFRFDIRPLFPQPIIKVTSNLLPHTFRGDRRQALDATSKMSEIIDRLGQLSAASQKLTIPITTGQRLRQSENQTIYILADTGVEPRGVAVGLLKVGKKDLYLFDENGQTLKVESAACILDFYIHESRQRAGLGQELFKTMLNEENWKPIKLSIDRPSEKLLAFMRKYYGLERTIPQANNFVLFEGFFDDSTTTNNSGKSTPKTTQQTNGLHITNSINTQLFGAVHLGEDKRQRQRSRQPDIISQVTQVAPAGRYGAPRPVCSMGQDIEKPKPLENEATSSTKTAAISTPRVSTRLAAGTEPAATARSTNSIENNYTLSPIKYSVPNSIIHQVGPTNKQETNTHSRALADDEVASITTEFRMLQATSSSQEQQNNENTSNAAPDDDEPAEDAQSTTSIMGDDEPDDVGAIDDEAQQQDDEINSNGRGRAAGAKTPDSLISHNVKRPGKFNLSKQHTGMKNISFGVGMAVTPSNKMEFDQENREDFGIVKINRPLGKLKSPPPEADAMSTVSSSGEGLTDQGYYDLKFYHNKLW